MRLSIEMLGHLDFSNRRRSAAGHAVTESDVNSDKTPARAVGPVTPPSQLRPRRRSLRWFGIGLRLFILTLAGLPLFGVSGEWGRRLGWAQLQSTDDAYL
jgi:hypothetical protein